MYSRSLRRVLGGFRPLVFLPARRIWIQRCFSTLESPPTRDSHLQPDLPSDRLQTNGAWDVALGPSTCDDEFHLLQQDSDVLYGISEHSPQLNQDTNEAGPHVEQPPTTPTSLSHSIGVFPTVDVYDMPGMLCIIRELERNFGAIREFTILRDKEVPGNYLRSIFINFKNAESVEKIKNKLQSTGSATVLLATRQHWQRIHDRDGGVGLEDIHSLLLQRDPAPGLPDNKKLEKDIEKTVDGMESATRDTETAVEDPVLLEFDSSSSAPPTPDIGTCDARIEILKEAHEMWPSLHNQQWLINKLTLRTHLTRSFIRWGGFYPNYRFDECRERSDRWEDGTIAILGQGKDLQNATRAMRDVLISKRQFLRQQGKPDHGLEIVNGQVVSVNWNISSRERAATEPTHPPQQEPTPGQPERKAQKKPACPEMRLSIATKSKLEKPKVLSREEEQSLQRLFAPSDVGLAVDPGTALNTDSRKAAKDVSLSLQKSQSISETESRTVTTATSRATKRKNTQKKSSSMQQQQSEMTAIENNRLRRTKKKKEEQQEQGFKTKLLKFFGL